MSTIQQAEPSNDGSDHEVHVELTQEIRTDEVLEQEHTRVITPTKDGSFSSGDDTFPESPLSSISDYRSIISNASWGTKTIAEMKFTVVSNWLFFVSASLQTFTSVVDLTSAQEEESQVWDDDRDDDDYVYTALDKTYYVLYSFAPFLFIISALIDVQYYNDQRAISIWSLSFWFPYFFPSDNNSWTEIETSEHQEQEYQRIIEVNTNNVERINSFVEEEDNSYSTMESTVAESPYLHLAAAVAFLLGACFEFYSTFLYDYYQDIDDWDDDAYLIKQEMKRTWFVSDYRIDFVGMHLYLLSGVLSLISQRDSFRSGWKCVFSECRSESTRSADSSYRTATLFMLLGTVLFVGGTLLDCTISWISDPALRHDMDPGLHLNQVQLSWFSLTSSLMWNIDAVLYVMADVLLYSLHKEGSEGQKWLCQNSTEADQETQDEEISEDDHDWYSNDNESMPILQSLSRESSINSYSSIVRL
mmetsp:Transcript_12827/g.32323  ORF Transcript_12827/g.32323 Transcript_12827/m.32323 type:complete len:474 (+) Transcript_12827:216-1637(+)